MSEEFKVEIVNPEKSFLAKEAEHVEGFAKECAVVTHSKLKVDNQKLVVDPDSKLEILSTSTQQKWSYDGSNYATMAVTSDLVKFSIAGIFPNFQ